MAGGGSDSSSQYKLIAMHILNESVPELNVAAFDVEMGFD